MASEKSELRSWKQPNGETLVVGTFLELNAHNAQLRLEDGSVREVPLAHLHLDDLAFIFAPPKEDTLVRHPFPLFFLSSS